MTEKEAGYQAIKKLGQGGFSQVFLVEKAGLYYAQKEISLEKARQKGLRKKDIEAEYWLLKSLNHPGIPKVYSYRWTQTHFSFVMDYVAGESLDRFFEKRRYNQKQLIDIMYQLGQIVAYLHDQNLIYGDLKPSNILVDQKGTIFLVDFGQVGSSQRRLGTPAFAAPEQYQGTYLKESDIYSFGKTFLYVSQNRQLDIGLQTILQKAVQPNPQNRYKEMADIVLALKKLEKGRQELRRCGYYSLVALSLFLASFWLLNQQSFSRASPEKAQDQEEIMQQKEVAEFLLDLDQLLNQKETVPKRQQIQEKLFNLGHLLSVENQEKIHYKMGLLYLHIFTDLSFSQRLLEATAHFRKAGDRPLVNFHLKLLDFYTRFFRGQAYSENLLAIVALAEELLPKFAHLGKQDSHYLLLSFWQLVYTHQSQILPVLSSTELLKAYGQKTADFIQEAPEYKALQTLFNLCQNFIEEED